MDVDHREGRGGGAARPPEFGVRGTLMQIVPQILSFFKISSTRLLALQCSIQEVDAEGTRNAPQIQNIALEKACNIGLRE